MAEYILRSLEGCRRLAPVLGERVFLVVNSSDAAAFAELLAGMPGEGPGPGQGW